MHQSTGSLFKGVVTTILGVFATGYGMAGQAISAGHTVHGPMALVSSADPMTISDLSALLGPLLAMAGAVWTWFLVQKEKKKKSDRESHEADQLSQIRVDLAKAQADIQITVEKVLAQNELKHAETQAMIKDSKAPEESAK